MASKDDQVPPTTFENFVAHLKENRKKNEVILPEGLNFLVNRT
jgi:hypothetical protein